MNSVRFLDLAETYGADLDRWPAAERPAARAWLAAEPSAAGILAHARTLDARIGAFTFAEPPESLERHIVADLDARQAAARRRGAWATGAVSLAVLAVGVVVGLAATPRFAPPPEPSGGGAFEQTSFGRLVAEAPASGRAVRT